MKRDSAIALALAVGVVALPLLLVPSCTRDPDDVLRFMIWGSPDEIRVVQGFVDEFREAHPEVAVQVETAPAFGYEEKLKILFLGGNAPDVMYLDQDDLPAFAANDWLLPLDEYAERDREELDPDDFFAETFERFRHQGRLYGICKDFTTLVLYYNRDLFEKWDVPLPTADWTWDDFLARAKALTHDTEQGRDWGFLLETWPEELFPWIWQAGGAVASEEPPEWLMGRPEHLDASAEGLQFLSDLIWEHRVAPGPSTTRDQQGNALFLRGQAAMCTYGRWACMEFRHIKDFDWGVAPLPRHEQRAATNFAVCYAIGRTTRRAEDAWTLVKFLTSKAAQRAVAHSAQAVPARKSAARSDAFHQPEALSHLPFEVDEQPYLDAIPHARFSPRFRTAAEVKTVFGRGVEPLWNGTRRDARALLEELQPRLEEIVARSRVQTGE